MDHATDDARSRRSDATRDGTASADRANGGERSGGRGRDAESPTEIPGRGWLDVGKRVVAEISADQIPVVSAGVAFYAWIALIPALLALSMVYGLVSSPEQVTTQIAELTSGLSDSTGETLEQVVQNATGVSDSGLGIGVAVALAGVLWSASGGMDGLVKGINIAYDEEPRTFLRRRGLAILLSLGGIVLAVVAVALLGGFTAAAESIGLSGAALVAAQVGRWVLLALLILGGLATIYRFAPHRDDPRMAWVTPGALIAAVLWLAGSAGFAFYVNQFGSYNETYGAVAGIIVLNLWLFLSAFVVLLGAEINSELEAQTAQDTTTGPSEPMGQRGAVKADTVADRPG